MAVKAGGVMYSDAWVIGLYVNSPKSELTKTFTPPCRKAPPFTAGI